MNRETIIQMAREAGLAEVTDTAESLPADYVDALAKLCALAVAKEREECGWQPIETAPKDGTRILAYIHIDDGEIGVMKWMDFGAGLATWVWADELMGDVDPDPYQPTHWMPLPPPPSAIRARGEDV